MSTLAEKSANGRDGHLDPFSHPFSLKEHFGKKWKIQMEESFGAETAEVRRGFAGWYETVPTSCGGFIALHQHHPTVILEFFTPKQRITCRKLAEKFKDTSGIYLDDRFDGFEIIFRFPLSLFSVIATAVGARKRRQGRPLTEAQRAAFAQGREKGMAALKKGRNSLLSTPPENPGRTKAVGRRGNYRGENGGPKPRQK